MNIHSGDIRAMASIPARERVAVSVAWGDGIGPEIMDASLKVLLAAGARLDVGGKRRR